MAVSTSPSQPDRRQAVPMASEAATPAGGISREDTAHHPLWTVAAALFLSLALSLMVDLSARLFSASTDFIAVFSALSQGLLALLAGSMLTPAGGAALDRLLADAGIAAGVRHRWRAGLALALLLLMLAVRLLLPAAAGWFNDEGLCQQFGRQPTTTIFHWCPPGGGQLAGAIDNYRRAVNLAPGFAAAHYNLGYAYELLLEYDRALAEYQRAWNADRDFFHAANNLARLYLLRQQQGDAAAALAVLNQGIGALSASSLCDQRCQHSLYKNRAWAYLQLDLPALARQDLQYALALRPDGAAAHCLLAQILEQQQDLQAARGEWEACLRYQDPETNFVEAAWLATAEERLLAEAAP